MTTKERLHQVIDEMSDAEAAVKLRRIQSQRDDPLLRFLEDAPEDDEPLTEAEQTAVAEVEADRSAGSSRIPLDEIKRKLT